MAFQEKWQSWNARFVERPLRERTIIVVTLVVGVVVLGWALLIDPAVQQSARLEKQLNTRAAEQAQLLRQLTGLQEQMARDPNAPLRQRLERLKRDLQQVEASLARLSARLVSPEAMVDLLKRILARQDSLQLLTVEHFRPEPLRPPGEEAGEERAGQEKAADHAEGAAVFAHEVEITVTGDYFSVLDYLRALESLDQRLIWQRLDYEVEDWPRARAAIRVRTLSLEKEWLGV